MCHPFGERFEVSGKPRAVPDGANLVRPSIARVRFDPPRLHRPIGMLRHTAVERHVGMRAKPAVGISGKYHGGAAGARKRACHRG
jgi:hypothetical protein